jgi:hypothetical protein
MNVQDNYMANGAILEESKESYSDTYPSNAISGEIMTRSESKVNVKEIQTDQ